MARAGRGDFGFWRALPLAALCWVLALWGVGRFLSAPEPKEEQPEVVEEKLVELPPPPVQTSSPAPQPAAVKAPSTPQPTPAPQVTPPPPAPPPPTESKPQVAAPPPPPPPPPPTATSPAPVAGVESHGPIAISQPDPQLPDDLLQQVTGATITVRVLVGVDGSLSVDVPDRNVDPRVRRALIDDLKQHWRFSPAMQAGKPVSMSQDFSFSF